MHAFIAQLDPTIDELTEIKTVVSEAVTNAIIHGYESDEDGYVYITVRLDGSTVELEVRDEGIGIQNIEEAKQPLYTTKPELERSGMGFTIMENFMDEMTIESRPNEGTVVRLKKNCQMQKQCTIKGYCQWMWRLKKTESNLC